VAIVERFTRPVLPVDSSLRIDTTSWPHDIVPLPALDRVTRAAAAVGRLTVTDHTHPWVGTAFLAGPRLALTAAFAVEPVAVGAGRDVRYRDHRRLGIEFIAGAEIAVERIAFLHPYFRIALLELAADPAGPEPLVLAATIPEDLAGKEVALISGAAQVSAHDPDVARIYGANLDQRYFVQPGRAHQIGGFPDVSFDQAPGLLHDCSSLPGSGGAPLVDLAGGDVLGLHTSGRPGVTNYAEILWEFARDPVVWEYPLQFRPDPRPSWLGAWGAPSVPATPQVPPVRAGDRSWTVDVVPIVFSAPEFTDLLRCLYEVISDTEVAMNLALDAGVTRGTVDERGSAEQVWRRILEKAGAKGVLRRLVERIAFDPEYAGVRDTLTRVL
jgi:hypothetical protein